MKTVIVANGEINDYAAARAKLAEAEYLIACDGGLRHFPPLGLTPHCLIGDFDSAPAGLLADYKARGIPVISYPPEKDETDLALALAHALTLAPASVVFIGALGGRVDHMLANLHVLVQAGDVPAEIWDETVCIRLIKDKITLDASGKTTLSLIPLTLEVTGITTRGLKYPLNNETLHAGEVRGVSNVFTAQTAEISIKSGFLLAICYH
jgi:thiamine pyrophosphokinase